MVYVLLNDRPVYDIETGRCNASKNHSMENKMVEKAKRTVKR